MLKGPTACGSNPSVVVSFYNETEHLYIYIIFTYSLLLRVVNTCSASSLTRVLNVPPPPAVVINVRVNLYGIIQVHAYVIIICVYSVCIF